MKKFLWGTAIAVISATSVAFAENNLGAFDNVPSDSVQTQELDVISGKGSSYYSAPTYYTKPTTTTYRTGSGAILSQSQVQKIFAYKPGFGGYSPYTGKYIYPF